MLSRRVLPLDSLAAATAMRLFRTDSLVPVPWPRVFAESIADDEHVLPAAASHVDKPHIGCYVCSKWLNSTPAGSLDINRPTIELDLDFAQKLELCERRIGYVFQDKRLLQAALTHASGADHRLASNERLEFLGDAILGAVVCELLYPPVSRVSRRGSDQDQIGGGQPAVVCQDQ